MSDRPVPSNPLAPAPPADVIADGPSCPAPIREHASVQLGHGSGGRMMNELIRDVLIETYGSDSLRTLDDFGIVSGGNTRWAISTDSFVVDPLFFPGGDIGELAVYGTVNDVAVSGARPVAVSVAMILEEGFPMVDLRRIALSIRTAADRAGVSVVTGDTKVVHRGKADGIYITTTGIGLVERNPAPSVTSLRPGDFLLLSGFIAEHGMAILSRREGLAFETPIESDCAPLNGLVDVMMAAGGEDVHTLRDATRGGVAAVLNEFATTAGVGVRIREDRIPVRDAVAGACAFLGFDPLAVANEGKLVAAVARRSANAVLEAMRDHPLGRDAVIVGDVVDGPPGLVTMFTSIGGQRIVDLPVGELLPRIC